jgi:hypothetical protein
VILGTYFHAAHTHKDCRPVIYFSVFCISVSLLALEIAWMRLLSFQQWSHVASMVITLAMLGFAASGSYLAFLRDAVRRGWQEHFGLLALLYAGSIPWTYIALQQLPLDPFMLVWDIRQGGYLLAYSFFLLLPFLLGAASIGILFCAEELAIGRIYFVNLLGSGLGVVAAMGLLFAVSLRTSLCAISLTGLLGALVALPGAKGRQWSRFVLAIGVVLSLFLYVAQPLRISPNKPLARTLRIPDVRELDQRTTPWGIVHVLEGPSLRSLPGLSLRYQGEIPGGRMLFLDGDSMGLQVSTETALKKPMDFFGHTIQSAGYQTLDKPRVLVLGAGGGAGVVQALWQGAQEVTLVEQNPVILEQTRDWVERFSGRFSGQEVVCRMSDPRRFLQNQIDRFDLITLDGLGSAAAAFAGANAFQGDYLLTVEGFCDLFDHLRAEEGILAFTSWTHMPPRETFKLVSTLVEVYRRNGVPDPSEHLFVARGWSACTTLAFRSPLSDLKIRDLRSFCDRNDFDLVYYPGMASEEANRRHRLERPFYHEGIKALLGDQAESFEEDYLFFIQAASDERPYFHRFFKWRTFPVLWKELGRDWILLREWGYVALWLTFASACVLGGLFLLPAMTVAQRGKPSDSQDRCRRGRTSTFLFFGCLGSAFMCYEMLFIEAYVFFLSYPLLSVSVIVSAILVFSSLGSLTAGRWLRAGIRERLLLMSCFVLAALGAASALGLMPLLRRFLDSGLSTRCIIAFLSLAPPCFLMGIPFPTGLSWTREGSAHRVPLCWGINGWSSVVFAALTPLLAVHLGLPGTLWIGAGLYLAAGCLGMSMVRGRS